MAGRDRAASAGVRSSGAATRGITMRNSLPLPSPSLRACTEPPCISINCLTMVRPMPSPPWVRSSDRSPCRNASNTCGNICASMPMPSIAHAQYRVAAFRLQRDVDARVFGRILAGVGEQVRNHLAQPHIVALHVQLRAAALQENVLVTCLQQGPHGFQRGVDDARQVQCSRRSAIRPRMMCDTSSRSSTRWVSSVACRSSISPERRTVTASGCPLLRMCATIANRRERIAQLVRQDGEKFVLASIRLAQ